MNMADDNMALQHNVHGDFDEFYLEAQFDPEQLKTKEELADEKEAQNNDKKKPKIEDEPDMYDYIESKWDDIAGYVFNNERRVVWGDYEAWLAGVPRLSGVMKRGTAVAAVAADEDDDVDETKEETVIDARNRRRNSHRCGQRMNRRRNSRTKPAMNGDARRGSVHGALHEVGGGRP